MKYAADIEHPASTPDTEEGRAFWHETARIEAWHRSFNAAVSGLATRTYTAADIVEKATAIADKAHGAL